ncbi:MAG: hypothetical protein WCI38_04085 [Chthoniobacterales bacterium]|jgi:hypothetical protein
MKAKKYTTSRTANRHGEALPHELGAHLFALIRRNIVRPNQPAPSAKVQLQFAF